MVEEVLKIRNENKIRILTMNRADKLNALNFALTEALVLALEEADAAMEVRAVVLTGAGRAFCAGADTSEFSVLVPENQELVNRRAQLTGRLHSLIPQMETPVIAAVNGFAMGGGAGLALACDYVIADERAVFSFPEVKSGIVAAIVMAALVRHVGRKKAFGLAATGRRVDASEALALGLATECVVAGTAVKHSIEFAREIASYPQTAIAATKRLVQRVADLPLIEGIALGVEENARMRAYQKSDA